MGENKNYVTLNHRFNKSLRQHFISDNCHLLRTFLPDEYIYITVKEI